MRIFARAKEGIVSKSKMSSRSYYGSAEPPRKVVNKGTFVGVTVTLIVLLVIFVIFTIVFFYLWRKTLGNAQQHSTLCRMLRPHTISFSNYHGS